MLMSDNMKLAIWTIAGWLVFCTLLFLAVHG